MSTNGLEAFERARQKRIERRAYEIWEQEGRPEGRAFDHWRQAVD